MITKEFFIKDVAAEEVKVQTRLNVSGVNPAVPSNQVRPGVDGRIGGIATKLDVSLDSLVQTNYSLSDNWDNSLTNGAYWLPSQFDQATSNTATFQDVALNGQGSLSTDVTPVLLSPLNNVKRAFSMQTTLSDGIVNQTSSGGSFADFAAVRNFSRCDFVRHRRCGRTDLAPPAIPITDRIRFAKPSPPRANVE